YTNRELCPALDQLQKRVRACHDPAAPRVAGPVQCQFCRAKAVCPEARAAALSLTDIPPNVSLTVSAAEAAAQFTPEMLGQFLERAVVAEGVIAACREEARRRLNAGEIIPGWRLKPGQQRETITDPQACFDRCHRRGVPLIAFLSAIAVKKCDLKELLRQATGLRGQALEAELDHVVDGITEVNLTQPMLTAKTD
ncbi:MAG TPA: DUF2800 domain-containing protein, partial [Verrucomicrobiae bacterium]